MHYLSNQRETETGQGGAMQCNVLTNIKYIIDNDWTEDRIIPTDICGRTVDGEYFVQPGRATQCGTHNARK